MVKALIAALAVTIGFTAPALAEENIKLVYATYIPSTLTLSRSADWFMDEVTQRTDGRVTFERYYAQSMLSATDLAPGLSRGAVDLTLSAPGTYNTMEYPYSQIVMPYTTSKVDAVAYALDELYRTNDDYRLEYERHDTTLLWHLPNLENTLWTNTRVSSQADLQGLRLRAAVGIAIAYEALGATPVAMSPVDALEAFRRGAIDGLTTWPMDAAAQMGG